MMIKNKISRLTWLTSLLLCVVLVLTSCFASVVTPDVNEQPKSDILKNIEATEKNNTKAYNYAADYLVDWGFPEFETNKVKQAENIFINYYNYEGGFDSSKSAVMPRAAAVARIFLRDYYPVVDKSNKTAVTDAIISAFVDYSGDPYGVYRPPQDADDYETDMSGKFGGIGVVVEYDHQNETIMVSEVLMGSPAEEAGLEVGDYVYAVGGKTVEELGYLNAIYYVRGEIGTSVTLTMLRDGQYINFTIVRREVTETSVSYEISDDGYGYIKVTSFKANTDEQFCEAVDALRAANVKGVIFDMRNNLGGYVDTVVNMLSYILPTGLPVISYQYKMYPKETRYTVADKDAGTDTFDSVLDIPMVVLCNEFTASAAEIFTAAIRDYRDDGILSATTVGTPTYKKGVMQSGFMFSDNSSLTLTIAYYNPPCDVNYHGIGITPDVTVELTGDTDTQMDAAIEELFKLINK